MEKLMKPAEYAQEIGISRQAVYAKIKRGILKSKNVEGKLYIVIDNETTMKKSNSKSNATTPINRQKESTDMKDYKALLQAKDETITVLKETVVDLKESNKQISTTLRGEIDLLKDAFFEMRTMYARQLEHKKQDPIEESETEVPEDEVIEVLHSDELVEETVQWVGVKKFFKFYNITKEKKQNKVLKRFEKAYKKGDTRLMKKNNKLKLNLQTNYEDILD